MPLLQRIVLNFLRNLQSFERLSPLTNFLVKTTNYTLIFRAEGGLGVLKRKFNLVKVKSGSLELDERR